MRDLNSASASHQVSPTFSVSYILREKPWSLTLSMYGYLAGSRKPWSPVAIHRLL